MMIWVYWISGLALALIWSVGVLHAALNLSRLTDVTGVEWTPKADFPLPSLTIVVPARNEEAALEPALRSLLGLDYPEFQVVAVNDRSVDKTGEIMDRLAREAGGRLRVVHVKDLPAGWLGKTHAMWLGAQQAGSEWILFTDADCIFHPEALRRALAYAMKNHADHLVMLPTFIMRGFGERMMLSFFPTVALLALRLWKVSDPKARDHVGAGAFNLVRRTAYEKAGTFERLRLEIVEDMKLGESVKKAGLRSDVVLGPGLVRLRWVVGTMGFVNGLEKNLFAFLEFRVSWALAVCLGFAFIGIWPSLGLLLAPGWAKAGFGVAVVMCAAVYWRVSRYTGISPLFFVTYPVAAALASLATLRSAFLAVKNGGVTWRGTKYSLKELRHRHSGG
ncbi:MAG TPA: glycosyltransferase [Alphaproteobacteria bacterium]|nr:glycosyltransferase [Alphaproteobacteria bacterium]